MMTDEQFITQPTISKLALSPDEKAVLYIQKTADLENNRYLFKLYVYKTDDWKFLVYEYLLNKADVWWFSSQKLIVPKDGDQYALLDIGTQTESSFECPAKIQSVVHSDENGLLFILQERIPQDEDFYMTQSLPFLADGIGYIQSFSSLWRHDKGDHTWQRLSGEKLHVKTAVQKKNQIYFTGYERTDERVDFQHSALYRLNLPENFSDFHFNPPKPEVVIPDWLYRIDTIQYVGEDIWLAASDMKLHGQNQNPHFYRLDDSNMLNLLAANEHSTAHTLARDWKSTSRKFCPGSEGLYFLSTVRGDVCLKQLTVHGRIEEMIHKPGTIDDFVCFSDGRIVLIGAFDSKLDELYLYQNENLRQISNIHDHFEALKSPYKVIPYEFESGGQTIDCFVLPPKNFHESGQYPAILSIHGGHKMAYGKDVWMLDFQLWSDEGYFVIFCNPRGSDGQDNDFANIIGSNAVSDTEDILKSLDLILDNFPQIDINRIGVTGGSYGGYLTNWLITQTNRFACAVAVRSISNRISKQMSSDTGFRYPLISTDNRVWKDAEKFWKSSPLAYADNCRTPTLFIHAEGDYRCPVSEAMQMYTALKLNSVQSKFILFKGESHALAVIGKPRARLKHSREIRKWFSLYLQPQKKRESKLGSEYTNI